MTVVLPDMNAWEVTPLNGHRMSVLTQQEYEFYTAQQQGYLKENAFSATSDIADLDRLLGLELQLFRIERYLLSGADYENHPISNSHAIDLRRQQKYLTTMVGEIKVSLGLSKDAREKAQAESVGAYLVELRRRAKEMGVKREAELTQALTLSHQLISLVETLDRCNDTEKMKLALSAEEILQWIRDKYIPDFRAIDEYFRTNSQRYWVGTL